MIFKAQRNPVILCLNIFLFFTLLNVPDQTFPDQGTLSVQSYY